MPIGLCEVEYLTENSLLWLKTRIKAHINDFLDLWYNKYYKYTTNAFILKKCPFKSFTFKKEKINIL